MFKASDGKLFESLVDAERYEEKYNIELKVLREKQKLRIRELSMLQKEKKLQLKKLSCKRHISAEEKHQIKLLQRALIFRKLEINRYLGHQSFKIRVNF